MLTYRIVLTVAFFVLVTVFLKKALRARSKYFTYLLVIASCYGIGKCLQIWHFGPIIFRSYLADIGFVPLLASWPLLISFNKSRLLAAKHSAIIWTILAVGVEFVQMWANPYIPDGTFGARGDWWDVVIFISTFIFVQFYFLENIGIELVQRSLPRGKKKRM